MLMGLERLNSNKQSIARPVLSTQEFLEASSRDVLHESNENFEPIHTMRIQRPVELKPERWTCIRQVPDWLRRFAQNVKVRRSSLSR